MEDIPTEALIEIRLMLEQSIDTQFQAWMAITFAVIVASYSARNDLTLLIRTGVAVLYSLAVAALWYRWNSEAIRLGLLGPELVARSINFDPHPFSPLFRILTWWLGTITTLVSIFYFRNESKKTVSNKNNV